MWRPLRSTGQECQARARAGVRVYAVGDVHGRADLLDQLFSAIDADIAVHPIGHAGPRIIHVFLGDYIDRGPASKDVLDLLIERGRRYKSSVYLKGNHEAFLETFFQNPEAFAEWQQVGGIETLLSYGIRPTFNPGSSERCRLAKALASALPQAHREFLGKLRLSFRCGDFYFAHAGIRPGIPLADQKEEDLLWIRDGFLRCEEDFGKIIVHGHSPVREIEFHSNRINIDTGAYASGQLSCLRIEGSSIMSFSGMQDELSEVEVSEALP